MVFQSSICDSSSALLLGVSMRTSSKSVKSRHQLTSSLVQVWIKYFMENQGVEILAKLLFLGALINLWFNFVSIRTTVLLLVLIASSSLSLLIKLARLKKQGALNRVSVRLRKVLLERSFFDILCDIWYFEALKRHVRFFLTPFIVKKTPQEIIDSLEDVNPALKQIILRKGTINVLPTKIKEQLLVNYANAAELRNANEAVMAQDWDRINDYELFVQERKNRQPSKTLLHVIGLMMNKPIVNKRIHGQELATLNRKAGNAVLLAGVLIFLHMQLVKSSRQMYGKAFQVALQAGLIGLGLGSAGVYLITKKKQKLL